MARWAIRRLEPTVLRAGLTCLALAACHAAPGSAPSAAPVAATATATAHPAPVVSSNVLRADYAGSAACARCHADLYAQWSRSPMHNMTRLPAGAEVHAPFDGRRFHFKDDAVLLESAGGARFMSIESRRKGTRVFRVTRVIGGHHREDFAGVEVARAAADAPLVGDAGEERVLPVSWLLASHEFRYKGYSVMVGERPELRPGGPWAQTCLFCHNTVPYLSTVLGALAGAGTPPYQGEVVDGLLPPERRWGFTVTDGPGLERALSDEIGALGVRATLDGKTTTEALRAAVKVTRNRFDGAHVVEVGIGCESCHGGSREHVAEPRTRPSFEPRSRLFRVDTGRTPPTEIAAQRVNRVCARCHQVLFSRYPWTWEGGRRASSPGGANINSGEARDLLLGHCAGALSCVTCHDPHAPDNAARMKELDGTAGDRVCLRCHAKLEGNAALAAHTHHSTTGAGSRCLACHMPRKNLSLDTRLGRYHRIASPTDEDKVLGDRPLECALCHADRSVETIVADMERLFGKRYDRARLRLLYGPDLGRNALALTLDGGKPHEQAVAAALLGEARDRTAAPSLWRQLANPIPLVRCYVLGALESLAGGGRAPVDLHADVRAIQRDARAWLGGAGLPVGDAPPPEPATGVAPSAGAMDPVEE